MSHHNPWTGNEHHSRHQSERYHEFSGYGSICASKSRDHSGWSSRESTEENPIPNGRFIRSRQNAPEGKELGRGDRYYKNMSPGFDGIERLEQRNSNHTLENDHHSHRYVGRGRSRSQSRNRSRIRGRSRSRSLSRGGRGWSRSRSRSRSEVNAKGRTRSRSPSGDYRRQSYGWSDRSRLPDKPFLICRDFPAGNCRRGSQCRFLHPDDRDRNLIEDDMTENWKYRADHDRIPNHSDNNRGRSFDSRDDVSDVQFLNRSRSMVPCRGFLRGMCRWGDNCRFSHHFASDDGFVRNASFEEEIPREAKINRRPPCKYFAAGRCARDNCRFSHNDPKLTDLGVSRREVTDTQNLHDKGRLSNVSKWDDSNMLSTDDPFNRPGDAKWDHTLENNGKSWGLRGCTDNSLIRDRQPSPPRQSSSYGRDIIGVTESIAKDNMSNEQDHLKLHRSQLNGEILNVQEQHQRGLENNDSTFSTNALQQDVSLASHYQRRLENNEPTFSANALQQDVSLASHYQRRLENNVPTFSTNALQQDVSLASHYQRRLEYKMENSFGSGVIDLTNSSKTTLSKCFSRQNSNQNVESAFPGPSNETGREQNILNSNRSNGFSTDLNGPDTPTVSPMGLQAQMQYHHEGIQVRPPSMLENARHFFPGLLNVDLSAQRTNSPAAIASQPGAPVTNPTLFFTNEQSQSYPGQEVSNLRGVMMPSLSATSEKANPLVSTISCPLNPVNSMENGGGTPGLSTLTLTGVIEPSNQMHAELSSLPIVGMQFESIVEHSESPQVKQHDVVANLEVNETIGEESKGIEEKKASEIVDGCGKVEGSNALKDEKGMRIFKNALVEFVKEALKPKWKEGKMSRDVHKTIVKKVVDKVTNTIQADQIPKTQDKVDLYLSNSKTKITKLVQAYIDRCPKDSKNQ